MTTRRSPGQGTIRTLPSGRRQLGVTVANGKREWSKPFDANEDEAERALAAFVEDLGPVAAVGGLTFAAYGESLLDRLEIAQRKDPAKSVHARGTIEAYRNVFNVHLKTAPFANEPFVGLEERPALLHLDSILAKRSRSTANVALAAFRLITLRAKREGVISRDPLAGFKFAPESRTARDEKRSFFTVDQHDRLLAAARPDERCMMRLATGLGLRVMELVLIHLPDWNVDDAAPSVFVRYGSRDGGVLGPPKNGKCRRVYLFGDALDAAREWTDEHLPKLPNPRGLVFPSFAGEYRRSRLLTGAHRVNGRKIERWEQLLAEAGIASVRPKLTWHSFRHTCATWLLSGHFGRKWAPEEVMKHLGHSSLDTTLSYARIVDDRLAELAKATTAATITRRSRATIHTGNRVQSSMGAKKCCFGEEPEELRELRSLRDRCVIAAESGEQVNVAALALATRRWTRALDGRVDAVLAGGAHAGARLLDLLEALAWLPADDAEDEAAETAGGAS